MGILNTPLAQILLDLDHFSAFLALSAMATLLVRPHRKYVFVLNHNYMFNNRDRPVLMEKGLFIPRVSPSYCEPESHHLVRNPIQAPLFRLFPRARRKCQRLRSTRFYRKRPPHLRFYELPFRWALPIES